ncbi:MAG: hypothetical protein ACOH2V_00975 [Candidatus Saccharimonadaceae bacterium]
MKEFLITFKEKKYKIIGWSCIDFPVEFKDYKSSIDQIISNSLFHSEKYGITYLDLYEKIADFVEQIGSTYISYAYPQYLFKCSVFIKGTFIYELIQEEKNEELNIKLGRLLLDFPQSKIVHDDSYTTSYEILKNGKIKYEFEISKKDLGSVFIYTPHSYIDASVISELEFLQLLVYINFKDR